MALNLSQANPTERSSESAKRVETQGLSFAENFAKIYKKNSKDCLFKTTRVLTVSGRGPKDWELQKNRLGFRVFKRLGHLGPRDGLCFGDKGACAMPEVEPGSSFGV